MPGREYWHIRKFAGDFLTTWRFAVGDVPSLTGLKYLSTIEEVVFWLLVVIILLLFVLVFINFVVASGMKSHQKAV